MSQPERGLLNSPRDKQASNVPSSSGLNHPSAENGAWSDRLLEYGVVTVPDVTLTPLLVSPTIAPVTAKGTPAYAPLPTAPRVPRLVAVGGASGGWFVSLSGQ